ncbi:PH domain-like protein, partial [Corynespora cassiicola Philippines]
PQPSDYETDAPPNVDVPLPPPRSNEELNLSVLRRHYPDVVAIHHVASYAVLYTFSLDSAQWEKIGVEGTLFVCQLLPSPIGADRFAVIILNRRGLDNFCNDINSDDEVEISDEYIILQGDPAYGIWIFSEPPPSSTANAHAETADKIMALARQAAASSQEREHQLNNGGAAISDQVEASVPMGRQLSLRELFGQQREQDAAWSVHNHHTNQRNDTNFAANPNPMPPQNDVLGQLFMKAKQDYNGLG